MFSFWLFTIKIFYFAPSCMFYLFSYWPLCFKIFIFLKDQTKKCIKQQNKKSIKHEMPKWKFINVKGQNKNNNMHTLRTKSTLSFYYYYCRVLGPGSSLFAHILGMWPKPRTKICPRRRCLCQRRLHWWIEGGIWS